MIGKQGKHFTTAKIFKMVCKTLFVTVTILSPNFLLNKCCIKIMVDTCKIMETIADTGKLINNFRITKGTFLHEFCL